MTDLKNYGLNHRRAADHRLDGFFTGVAWFVATLLLLTYAWGALP